MQYSKTSIKIYHIKNIETSKLLGKKIHSVNHYVYKNMHVLFMGKFKENITLIIFLIDL